MKVWIDRALCTGSGLCEELAPDVFVLREDGLAQVKEGETAVSDGAKAEVPPEHLDAVFLSADLCAGRCIFLEE